MTPPLFIRRNPTTKQWHWLCALCNAWESWNYWHLTVARSHSHLATHDTRNGLSPLEPDPAKRKRARPRREVRQVRELIDQYHNRNRNRNRNTSHTHN